MKAQITDLQGSTPKNNAEIIFRILFEKLDENDPKAQIVLVNSAAAIIVSGEADSFECGMEIARESIKSGAAYKKLKNLVRITRGDSSRLEELEIKYD